MSADKNDPSATPALALKQLTPVLIVDAVEPCIKFWTDRLGFDVTNQVPDPDGKLIFASVQKGPIEIMYQTRASVISDARLMLSRIESLAIGVTNTPSRINITHEPGPSESLPTVLSRMAVS